MCADTLISSQGPKANLRRHLLFWFAVWGFLIVSFPPSGTLGSSKTLLEDGFSRWYGMVAIRSLSFLLSQIVFTYAVLYALVPASLWKKKYRLFIGLLLLLLIATAFLRYAIAAFLYNPLMQTLKYSVNSRDQIIRQSVTQCFDGPAFVSWTVISVRIFSDWQKRQRDNLRLRAENANAELQLLKAQIHPHFLFNTLNNIYSFALDRSPQAKKMLTKLEAILRYMIEECDQPVVALGSEIAIIKDYFDLERVRYGNSIEMQVEITGDQAGKSIAPLLMMPFVENSFKHGTSKILRAPWIKLFIQADNDVLHFLLTNSKPSDEPANGKKGIGLSNVKKRLELLYPSNHLLMIESTPNTFTVNMQIPLSHRQESTTPS